MPAEELAKAFNRGPHTSKLIQAKDIKTKADTDLTASIEAEMPGTHSEKKHV